MADRARAVIFHATSVPSGWRRVLADTVRARVAFRESWFPRHWRGSQRIRFLLGNEYESLSYVVDWRQAFEASARLDVRLVDVNDAVAMTSAARGVRDADLVVVLHSAAGDDLGRMRGTLRALQRRRGPLLVYFGNEYVKMAEKIAFVRESNAEYVASQLTREAGTWLYAETEAKVLHMPAALNPRVYRPLDIPRTVDVGFRGDRYSNGYALGDVERASIIEAFQSRAGDLDLTVDIEYRRVQRMAWNELLNGWYGVVGAESGTYYLERDDATRNAVVAYLEAKPDASWEEVRERFFARLHPTVSGKAISSRHFEPLGTQTVQLLLEGRYNDILEPDVHYISVRRDLSNLTDAVRRLKDRSERIGIAVAGQQLALAAHTYTHRVDHALDQVLALRPPTSRTAAV